MPCGYHSFAQRIQSFFFEQVVPALTRVVVDGH